MSSSAGVEEKEVCLVDDDLSVLTSMQFLLRSDGLKVRPFNKPEDFLEYVANHPVPLVRARYLDGSGDSALRCWRASVRFRRRRG